MSVPYGHRQRRGGDLQHVDGQEPEGNQRGLRSDAGQVGGNPKRGAEEAQDTPDRNQWNRGCDETAEPTASWVGAYDITPDWNPVLGPVPGIEGLVLAYGFSGHGFKLAPALGKVLAQSALGLTAEVDLTPYRLGRFAEGELLTGAYGVGSIS